MPRTKRNKGRLVFFEQEDLVVARHFRGALNDDPVLGALGMALQRKPAAWFHHDVLDLISIAGVDALIATPWPEHDLVFRHFGPAGRLELIDNRLDVLGATFV